MCVCVFVYEISTYDSQHKNNNNLKLPMNIGNIIDKQDFGKNKGKIMERFQSNNNNNDLGKMNKTNGYTRGKCVCQTNYLVRCVRTNERITRRRFQDFVELNFLFIKLRSLEMQQFCQILIIILIERIVFLSNAFISF